MSITINTDLEYLFTRLHISTSKIEMYSEKTIEEIVELEAADGNQEAIQYAADLFTNPSQLVELFQLADPNNKLVIMDAMSSQDISELIPMLEEDDLVQGLQYFTQDGLLNLLKEIPKEELVKTVFQMFSEEAVIQHMPNQEMDRLLIEDVDKDFLLEHLQTLPPIYMQQMLESVTGEEATGTASDLASQIGKLGDLAYKQAIRNLQTSQKQDLTLMLTSVDKKLYESFGTDTYLKMINQERQKGDMIEAMGVIKPEYLQKMMTELPQDLLKVVITQIDAEKFADALITKHPEILAQFVAG